jgi:hypothetical protein
MYYVVFADSHSAVGVYRRNRLLAILLPALIRAVSSHAAGVSAATSPWMD